MGKLGFGRTPLSRVSRADLEQEFRDAGFAVREVIRVSAPLLSDKWVVLAERSEEMGLFRDISGAMQGTGAQAGSETGLKPLL